MTRQSTQLSAVGSTSTCSRVDALRAQCFARDARHVLLGRERPREIRRAHRDPDGIPAQARGLRQHSATIAPTSTGSVNSGSMMKMLPMPNG